MLTFLHEELLQIPSSFWGVIVGSLFTIVGVVLTNRNNDKRLERQLRHDREEKRREAEFNLKREVYLHAVEAITVFIQSLGNFGNLSLRSEEIASQGAGKIGSVWKAFLVAENSTCAAVNEIMMQVTNASVDLVAARLPLLHAQNDIDLAKARAVVGIAARDRTLELMKQFNIERKSDPIQWEVLSKIFENEHANVVMYEQQGAEAATRLAKLQVEYGRLIFDHLSLVRHMLPATISHLRDELGMPNVENELNAMMKRATDDLKKKFDSAVAKIDNQLFD